MTRRHQRPFTEALKEKETIVRIQTDSKSDAEFLHAIPVLSTCTRDVLEEFVSRGVDRLHCAAGKSVSFAEVARVAGVSRAWLYNDEAVRAEIAELRERATGSAPVRPRAEGASDRSLRQLVTALRTREAELRRENELLREALACRLGEERATELIAPKPRC